MRWLILAMVAIFLAACPTSTRQRDDERLRHRLEEQKRLQFADGFFEDDDWDMRPEHEEDDLWDSEDDGYIPWEKD